MTGFMDGDGALLRLGHHLRLLLQAAEHTVYGIEETLLVNPVLLTAGGYQGGLVTYVGDVGARQARCLTGKHLYVYRLVYLDWFQMNVEYLLTLLQVGQLHGDLTVETAGAQ